ncbi:MAG: ArsR family transcriptional regulator [Vicinamibacterales bacterium]
MFDTLLSMANQDVRYAVRLLWRSKAFATAAVSTLALGIAMTTLMFALVQGILLRPLPVREQDRLILSRREAPTTRVQELQASVGLEQPVVSQQLSVLRNQGIVTSRKHGLSVRYALRDPAIEELLEVVRRILNNHLAGTSGMLRELQREARRG